MTGNQTTGHTADDREQNETPQKRDLYGIRNRVGDEIPSSGRNEASGENEGNNEKLN
jgi:hypothetical protein